MYVSLSDDNFQKLRHRKFIFPGNTGQVCIWRSSGQGHSHTSKKTSDVILPPLQFSQSMTTTAQTVRALHRQGWHVNMMTGNSTCHICA